MYEPISPVTSPWRTPRYGGMVMDLDPERLTEIQEASGMIYTPAVAMAGGTFQPTKIPELTQEEIETLSPRRKAAKRDSDATVKYSALNTEEDTSAKESVVGSPPSKKRRRRLSASERTASSSRIRTTQESKPKFVSKGKDIKNLQRDEARKRGIDEEDLQTPRKIKKTHASSLYGELQRLQKTEKAEARKQKAQEIRKPIVFGGKGQGKGGEEKVSPRRMQDVPGSQNQLHKKIVMGRSSCY